MRQGTEALLHAALDDQLAFLIGRDAPAHQGDFAFDDLDAGDPARVHAGTGVEVGRLASFGKLRVVGVSGDDGLPVFVCPFFELFFGALAFVDVSRDAAGVLQAQHLQRPPKPAQQHTVQPDQPVEQVVGLVAMHGE